MSSALAQTAVVTAVQDQFCAADRGGSNLNCTANDFTASVDFTQPAVNALSTCFAGDTVNIDVVATLSSSSPVRYDVGLFVGQNNQDPGTNFTAGTNNDAGRCSLGVFPTTPFPFFSADTDVCGDFTNNSSATLQVNSVKVLCKPVSPTDNRLNIPFLVAFDNQVSGNTCTVANLTAGTSAKCTKSSAGGVTGVTVQGYVELTKQTQPDGDTTPFAFTTTTTSGSASWFLAGAPTTATLVNGQTKRVAAPIPIGGVGGTNVLQITETLQNLWDAGADITCAAVAGSGNPVTVNKQTRVITATLTTANFGATCTITNTKRSKITLAKSVGGRVSATDQFTVSATTTGDFQDLNNGALASPRSVTTTGTQTSVNTVFTTRQRVSSSPSASAPTPAAVTLIDVAAGTTNLADYDTRLTCTNAYTGVGATPGGSLPSNQSATTFTFTPAPADDITCTYTNTPKPRITLQKAIAAGGGRVANTDQFALTNGTTTGTTTGTGSSVTSGALLFVGTSGSPVALSEAAAGTTSFANYSTAISCTNANGSSSTTLPSGSGTGFTVTPVNNDVIACTLTNTRKSATLTLRKNWSNAVVNNAVNVSATGINNRTFGSVANIATETDTDATTVTVFAGETVALAEAFTTGSATNYTAGLSCSGNNGALTYTAGNLNGSLAIANADTAIACTFANVRKSASLTLQKTWVNGLSGDAISVTTTGAVNNATLASTSTGNNSTSGTAATVFSAEAIVLPAESFTTGSAANYVRTLACSGNTNALAGGTAPQTLTVAPADSAITCTYTNARTSLTLVKTVTNDNGGTQAITAWALTATGPVTISGASGNAAVTNASVSAGTYALSESGPAGYTASSWNCVGGSQAGSSITLTTGQAATCTINNNDQAATLTLAKTVTNDNGGTAVATAWTLTATGPTTINGATGSAQVTNASVNAGTYTLTESGPAGYTAGNWSCSAGALTGNSLVLGNGEVASCSINNDDQPATLTLVKTVTNNDGGLAVATAWTLTATGPTTISGATGTAAVTNAAVDAGTYLLSETGPPNYLAGAWSCSAGALTGSSLVLGNGVTASCSIDNDDQKVSDLAITKSDAPDPVRAGETLVYTLTVTNNGPTAIASSDTFNVADTLPAGLNACVYLESAGSYTSGTGAWTGATIASGGSVTLTITCTVDPGYSAATLSNSASVAAPPGFSDPVPGNDSAGPVVTTVSREANLSVTKSNATGTLVAGTTTTYTLTITNAGPAHADNAVLTDPAVAGLNVTAVNCTGTTGGGVCPGVVTVAALQGAGLVIPTLPAGATVTFTVTATVTATGQ